jgi:acylphosphatase
MTAPEKSHLVRSIAVEGVVQGVGYREFTRRAALRLNVSDHDVSVITYAHS